MTRVTQNELKPYEKQALRFLYASVEHEIGEIDDEPKLAAALCFAELARKGLVCEPPFPITRLSPHGLIIAAALNGGD